MMSKRTDGGPAFPTHNDLDRDNRPHGGMTLRDWFATHAPAPRQEEIEFQYNLDRSRNPHNYPNKPKLRDRHEIIAFLAYRYADAMLAARSQEPTHEHP